MARTMQHFVDHFEETPVVVLACLIRYRPEKHAEGSSVFPAVQNLDACRTRPSDTEVSSPAGTRT